MKEYFISSKLYVFPTNGSIWAYRLLFVCVFIVAISGGASVITTGINPANIGMICAALVICASFKPKKVLSPEYVFCIVKAHMHDANMELVYEDRKTVSFDYNDISSLEYSDKLNCLRIVGQYVDTEKKKSSIKNGEWLFYLEEKKYPEFIEDIQNKTAQKIVFVDR